MTDTTTVRLTRIKRRDGSRYLLRWHTSDGKKHGRTLPPRTTKREARQHCVTLQRDIHRDDTGLVASPPERLTLVNFLNQMIDCADVHFRTKVGMRQSRDKLTKLLGPDIPVSRVTLRDAERYRDTLDSTLKRTTVVKHVALLKGLWSRGQKAKLVMDNPFRSLELRAAVRDDTILTYSRVEVEALIDAAATLYPARAAWWKALFLMSYTTGLRIGELDHLRWSDVDLKEQTWTVRPRSAGTHNGYPIFAWEPKGRKSRGPFAMPNRAVAALSALSLEIADDQRTPYIFLCPSALARLADHIVKYGNLPDRCVLRFRHMIPRVQRTAADRCGEWVSGRSFHNLRKSFASGMASRVMPPALKAMMGHADIKTTMEYYVSIDNDELGQKIRECFDGPAALKLTGTA